MQKGILFGLLIGFFITTVAQAISIQDKISVIKPLENLSLVSTKINGISIGGNDIQLAALKACVNRGFKTVSSFNAKACEKGEYILAPSNSSKYIYTRYTCSEEKIKKLTRVSCTNDAEQKVSLSL